MGQGAAGALPVVALYLQQVFNDPQLGYNENAIFDMPEGYNPCSLIGEALEEDDMSEIEEIYE